MTALKETCSKLLQDQGGNRRHGHLDSLFLANASIFRQSSAFFGRTSVFSGKHQPFGANISLRGEHQPFGANICLSCKHQLFWVNISLSRRISAIFVQTLVYSAEHQSFCANISFFDQTSDYSSWQTSAFSDKNPSFQSNNSLFRANITLFGQTSAFSGKHNPFWANISLFGQTSAFSCRQQAISQVFFSLVTCVSGDWCYVKRQKTLKFFPLFVKYFLRSSMLI